MIGWVMAEENVIDFNSAKSPHVFARRERRADAMRDAFANYLEDGSETRQQRRQKARQKAKKKR
ncbi:Hypothetical protein HDN1F_10970 [gamma proteobacterium HdN1]|nr:Hypothetical protein HDN1F_10970 [gamma proteobacterium HdN1]